MRLTTSQRFVARFAPLTLSLCLFGVAPLVAAQPKVREAVTMGATIFKFPPYQLETDFGATVADRTKFKDRIATKLIDTSNYFLRTYQLKANCFDEYAEYYKSANFEKLIRVRVWNKYDDFMKDFQYRYDTDTIPGAFFGISEIRDDYNKKTGAWIREIGTAGEGDSDQEILRSLYHELGHLFMRTFLLYSMEMPSWIEEGNAQLFQYRLNNGTKPEEERDQRSGWLVEMVAEGSTIPWEEFTKVRNLDNLNFTFQDPMRSTIQYAQAWSVLEFIVGSEARLKAYSNMLKDMKNACKEAIDKASRTSRSQADFDNTINALRDKLLYDQQAALFKKNFGADLLAIEGKWKSEWITKAYEKDVLKKPILRYHRGGWHLMRSRYAKTKADKDKSIEKAELLFNDCVQQSPELAEGYVGLGRIEMGRGNSDKASAWFEQALSKGANSYDALLYGGIGRIQANSASDAVAPLRKAVAVRPVDGDGHFYLGQALAGSGQFTDECVRSLRKSREIDANNTYASSLIEGAVLFKMGKMSQANIAWLRAGNAGSSNLLPLFMALAKASDNQTEEALALLVNNKDQASVNLHNIISKGLALPALTFTPDSWPTLTWK